LIALGVMPGRTHGAKGIFEISLHDQIEGFQNPAHCQKCNVEGFGAYLVIRMFERSFIRNAGVAETIDVLGLVDQLDPLALGGLRLDVNQFGQKFAFLDSLVNRQQSFRYLGMVGTGVVKQVSLIV
jgi:hypothetical protein